jgi:hypothetical protein
VGAAPDTGAGPCASRSRAAQRLLGGVLGVAVALGCTAPAPYYLAPGQQGAPGIRRVLLCPPNLVYSLRSEVANAVEPVQKEIAAYLEARDLEVQHLDLREGRRRWAAAAVEARQRGSKEAALAIFAQGLGESSDFQILVMPSLLLHSVRVVDSSGTWNGVRRSMAMVGRPSLGGGGSADTFTKGVAYGGITGDVMVTSVHVMVFSRDGERVFEGRGGLDFIQEIDLTGARGWHYELRAKSHPLRDPEVLREGVEIALSPWLPRR